ncbi:MAG TPA: hypothetical protein EYH05_18495 [Anaerolineae bacterium]|nr:hypothetical protein [Anaerolineae bacterium]
MKFPLNVILPSGKLQKAPMVVLFVSSLGLIIWIGIFVGQHACPQKNHFNLSDAPLCVSLLEISLPLFVAFVFWAVSLTIWLANRGNTPVIFLLTVSAILSAGLLSSTGSVAGTRLFAFLLAWAAPLSFHFHHYFLRQRLQISERVVLLLLAGCAAVLSVPAIFWPALSVEQQTWYAFWRMSVRLLPVVSLALTVFWYFREYRQHSSGALRQPVRLLSFGVIIAFAPLTLLSLLPDTMGAPVYVPYVLTFPCLLLAPLTYAYVFFTDRLDNDWVTLRRMAVNYLLIIFLLVVYLAVAAILARLNISLTNQWLLVSALLSVALLFVFNPLRAFLEKQINWVWYGQEEEYTGAVEALSEALAQALDEDTLQRLLLHDLVAMMHFSRAALFLRKGADDMSLCQDVNFSLEQTDTLPAAGQVVVSLKETGQPLTSARLRRRIAQTSLQLSEQKLLSLPAIALWLPLVSRQAVQGVLLVGPKLSGEPFTDKEKCILAGLGFQAGSAMHNIRLVAELNAKEKALSRAHKRLLLTREQERKRIARWLHDSVVQQILGLTYQLSISRNLVMVNQYNGLQGDVLTVETENVRRELLKVVADLRRLIGDLRPAGLDELGLPAAIEGYITRVEKEYGTDIPLIELDLAPFGPADLPETVAVCLFRAAQEGVRNALNHAQATLIQIYLSGGSNSVVLKVCDNGRGFSVPAHLDQLAWQNHFGLVGVAEQADAAGGNLTICSQPGSGTELTIQVPLRVEENGRG